MVTECAAFRYFGGDNPALLGWGPRQNVDYVPHRSRAAYVAHLLTFLEAGGRLVVGTHNEETEVDTIADHLEAWGHRVVGRGTRPHRHPALSYKVCWIES